MNIELSLGNIEIFLGFALLLLMFLAILFRIKYPEDKELDDFFAAGMIIIIFLLGFIASLDIQEKKWNECIDKYGYKYCSNLSYE